MIYFCEKKTGRFLIARETRLVRKCFAYSFSKDVMKESAFGRIPNNTFYWLGTIRTSLRMQVLCPFMSTKSCLVAEIQQFED